AVRRDVFADHSQAFESGDTLQLAAKRFGQIRHLIEVGRTFLMDPAKQLGGAKALFTQLLAERSQALEVIIQQVDGVHTSSMSLAQLSVRTRSVRGRRKRFQ